MKPTGKEILAMAMTRKGMKYVYGAESEGKEDPKAFDCSELVQWACRMKNVRPVMPDGAIYQQRHCENHNTSIEIEDAWGTPGALLFRIDPYQGNHVAFSMGDGEHTFEAKGKDDGIGEFLGKGRCWTDAGLIPGVDYGEEWA